MHTSVSSWTISEPTRRTCSNRREGYTVPAGDLYPYQWNWDSGFIALGLTTFNPKAAKEEIETLLSATWPNGMVPQTIFWQDGDGYFPGPEAWQVEVPIREELATSAPDRETIQTSGITQPSMVIPATRAVYEKTGDEDFRERVRPVLDKALSWYTNYLVSEGLARYGALDLAERVCHDSTTLVESDGSREYFDPETGDGCGAKQFSWSAALWLEMSENGWNAA